MRVLLSALLVMPPGCRRRGAIAETHGPAPGTLADLGFMTGCWRGASGAGTVIDEYYTPPSDNLMLGVSRYTKGGTGHRLRVLPSSAAQGDSDLVLTPRPKGQAAGRLQAQPSCKPGAADWSNPQHDFPQRDQLPEAGSGFPGGADRGPGAKRNAGRSEWRMGKVACGKCGDAEAVSPRR